MTTLAPPNPATYRPIVRNAPYRGFVKRAFGPKSTVAERNMYRWLYKAFREQQHSSTFGARAQIARAMMDVDSIKLDAKAQARS